MLSGMQHFGLLKTDRSCFSISSQARINICIERLSNEPGEYILSFFIIFERIMY